MEGKSFPTININFYISTLHISPTPISQTGVKVDLLNKCLSLNDDKKEYDIIYIIINEQADIDSQGSKILIL